MGELPIACTLGLAALRARREGLLTDLWRRAADRAQSAEGIRLRFPADADVLARIARTVDAERQCCRFVRFQITDCWLFCFLALAATWTRALESGDPWRGSQTFVFLLALQQR